MRIIQFSAENVKRLKVVEITPRGNVVQISGRNGSGKSSVLDAIWFAIGGSKDIPSQPIRRGQQSARVRLDMGEIVVTRRFTEKGSTLTVENADGAKFPSPQKLLDDLIGELSFDPLAFAKVSPRQQFDEIKRIARIDLDLDQLDAENKADYDARTARNREAKELQARAEGIACKFPDSTAAVDDKALLDELQGVAKFNAGVDDEVRWRKDEDAKLTALAEEAKALEAKLQRIKEEGRALRVKINGRHPIAEKKDVAAIRIRLAEAGERNADYHRRTERAAIIASAQTAHDLAADLTRRIDERAKQKEDAIASARMPIPGLSLADGKVSLNGIPFDQASSAEQLRAGVAIAMAANPKLKVIRIKDGSLLDDDGLRLIEDMAGTSGYQVWIERVSSDGKVGIVMEDGEVVAENAANTEAALALSDDLNTRV